MFTFDNPVYSQSPGHNGHHPGESVTGFINYHQLHHWISNKDIISKDQTHRLNHSIGISSIAEKISPVKFGDTI